MEKLGIIREDVTPTESRDKTAFECDNEETGEAALVKRAEEGLEAPDKVGEFLGADTRK